MNRIWTVLFACKVVSSATQTKPSGLGVRTGLSWRSSQRRSAYSVALSSELSRNPDLDITAPALSCAMDF